MESLYDIKKILQLKSGELVELRIMHIAKLWYIEILGKRTAPYIYPMIHDLFPDLILRSAGPGNGESRITKDFYVEACQNDGKFSPGATSEAYNVVRALVGSNAGRYVDKAHDIQKRAAEELSEDKTKIQKLRTYYEGLIKELDTAQKIKFSGLFKEYLNGVAKAITKLPKGQAILFPFEPNELFLAFNNDYLGKLLTFTDDKAYADFFLWMNLAAMLRNEIGALMGIYNLSFERKQNVTYDCFFDLKSRERGNPAGLANESARKKAIPKCLTLKLPRKPETGLIGRDKIVDEACSQLESKDCIVLVNGLGGIGKTAVMKEVCDRFFTDGRTDTHVAWIACGESLKDDLLILRDPLGVPSDIGREDAAIAVVRKLQGLDGTLYLFLDNLIQKPENEEMGILNALREHVRIMITSRSKMEGIPSIPLNVLEKDPSIDVFYAYYKKDIERNYADEVWSIIHSDSVRCHTLLIELLAKAAQRTYGTVGDFRKKLEETGFFDIGGSRRFNTGRFDSLTIEESVIKLYDIIDLSAEQERIMRLFSIFTPEKVIYGAVEEWAELDPNEVEDLVIRGWLTRTEEGFVIHQIIRDSMILHMRRQGDGLRIEEYGDLINKVIDIDNYMPKDLVFTRVQARLTLAEDTARYLEARMIKKIQDKLNEDKDIIIGGASLFNNMGVVYEGRGDYEKALEYYGKALAIKENMFGPNHPDTAMTYNNMAIVYSRQGKYRKALEYFGKALTICECVMWEDLNTAEIYNNMAYVFFEQGDYDKALIYYEKALSVRERILGKENSDTAATYSGMADVFNKLGNNEKALEYYSNSLAIIEKVLGQKHPLTATIYNNMATAYFSKGDNDKILEYCEKALSIRECVFGKKHPDTAMTYHNMAVAFSKQGDNEKAIEFDEKALAIYENVFGEEHPTTAAVYANMAVVFERQGVNTKALEYYTKALSIRERVLGAEHPDVAVAYDNMAQYNKKMGDSNKALEYYSKALSIRERVLCAEHPDTIATYYVIAELFYEQRNNKKALEYYGKALAIQERALGAEHPNTLGVYSQIATIFHEQGNNEKALEYYGKVVAILERVLGTEHPDTATSYYNMALFYKNKGDGDKALEYYEKALSSRERVLGAEHLDTAATYSGMADVFNKLGNNEKALEYYTKALPIYERVLGSGHRDVAAYYYIMAELFYEQRNNEKALEYYVKATAFLERFFGAEHPDTIEAYTQIAKIFYEQRDYDKALEYYGKIATIFEQILGEKHPDMAVAYNNVALCYMQKGNNNKALEYYAKALSIRELVLGAEHPDTATSYNKIALCYRYKGNSSKALEYYAKAFSIRWRILGENHPDTVASYTSMAKEFYELGDNEQAFAKEILLDAAEVYKQIAKMNASQGDNARSLKNFENALTVIVRIFGEEHPFTAELYNYIAAVYVSQKDYAVALEYFEKALSIRKEKLGIKHPDTKYTAQAISMINEYFELKKSK